MEEFGHPDFVSRLKAGNEATYRELVDGILPWAKSLIKKKYGLSEEDARDVTQDFFQRIIEKIDQYDVNEGRFLS
jgi:DNA-directed RNA polymerase specialized sigma24 family protein